MKKFIETCYKCKVNLLDCFTVKDGIEVYCLKCPKCKEEYFTTSELMRLDYLKKRKSGINLDNTLKQKLRAQTC